MGGTREREAENLNNAWQSGETPVKKKEKRMSSYVQNSSRDTEEVFEMFEWKAYFNR